MDGKTPNSAIQLVLQQGCKTSCAFFVSRFSEPLTKTKTSGHSKFFVNRAKILIERSRVKV